MTSNSYILVAENLPPISLITFNALVHQLLTQKLLQKNVYKKFTCMQLIFEVEF